MKTLLIALSMFASVTSFAMPKVGDTALFDVTKGNISGTIELKLTAQSGSNFTLQQTIVVNGRTQVKSEQVPASDLLSDEQVQGILANCSQYRGTLETLNVPAGSFQSCHVPQQNSDIWVAATPFGFAKEVDQSNDGNLTAVLRSYSFGQ